MLMDKQSIFADQMSLIHAAGAFNATNVIDLWNGSAALPSGPLGTPPFDLGKGGIARIQAQITDAVLAAGGAATVKLQLVNADDDALTVNPTILADSGAIAKAALVPGYVFNALDYIPRRCAQRYLGIIITIATNNVTAGKLTAAIIVDRQDVGFV